MHYNPPHTLFPTVNNDEIAGQVLPAPSGSGIPWSSALNEEEWRDDQMDQPSPVFSRSNTPPILSPYDHKWRDSHAKHTDQASPMPFSHGVPALIPDEHEWADPRTECEGQPSPAPSGSNLSLISIADEQEWAVDLAKQAGQPSPVLSGFNLPPTLIADEQGWGDDRAEQADQPSPVSSPSSMPSTLPAKWPDNQTGQAEQAEQADQADHASPAPSMSTDLSTIIYQQPIRKYSRSMHARKASSAPPASADRSTVTYEEHKQQNGQSLHNPNVPPTLIADEQVWGDDLAEQADQPSPVSSPSSMPLALPAKWPDNQTSQAEQAEQAYQAGHATPAPSISTSRSTIISQEHEQQHSQSFHTDEASPLHSESTNQFTPEPEPGAFFFARFLPHNLAARQLFDLMSIAVERGERATGPTDQYPCGFNKGYYRIGFYRDKDRRQGFWTIGTGYKSEQVDIQLRPQKHVSSSKDCSMHIAPRHARISIHPISGFLMIENLSTKPVICTGYNNSNEDDIRDDSNSSVTRTVTINKGNTYVLHKQVTRLQFGDLSFNMEFERFRHKDFLELRNSYISISQESLPMQVIANPFMLLHDTIQPNVHTMAIIAEVNGSLSCGLNLRTGVPYIIKHSVLEPNQPTRQRQHNLMIAFSQLDSPYLIQTVVKQQSRQHSLVSYVMRMALFSIYSYLALPQHTITNFEILCYARDTLKGLRSLHEKNIYHGNINPQTLLLLPDGRDGTLLGMHAAICPLIKRASRWNRPFERSQLEAPSKENDIRALGAAWLWCFTGDNHGMTDQIWNLLADKRTRYGEPLDVKFLHMLGSMTNRTSSKRPTCQQLLANSFWASIKNKDSGRNRKREVEGDGQRKKTKAR